MGQLAIASPTDIWQDLVAFPVPTVVGGGMLRASRAAAKRPAVHRAAPHGSGESEPSRVRSPLYVYMVVSFHYCCRFSKLELVLL